MIQDSYAECLVERKTAGFALPVRILLAAGVVLTAVSILFIGLFGFLALILMCFAASRVLESLHVEYEYLFVGNKFSVDKILNKSRRKKTAEYALDDIRIIGPEQSGKVKDWDSQVKKVSDYTSGRPEARKYAFICQSGGLCEKVLFEPDGQLLHCMRMAAPRKFTEY